MRGFNRTSTLTLVVVVAILATAVVQLSLVVRAAQSIDVKAATIAKTGRGINGNTDSIVQLARTNKTATSILKTAHPLAPDVNTLVGLAQSIDGLAH